MPVTNVPSPGSPIRSNWAISVSNVANAAEAAIPGKVAKAGDTMTGNLHVGAPFSDTVVGNTIDTRGLIGTSVDLAGGRNLTVGRIGAGASAAGEVYVQFRRGTPIGSITIASATAVAYNTTSDPRLKETTGELTDAAQRVQTLGHAAYRGRWVGDPVEAPEWDLIDATDVAVAAPYAVQGEPDAVTDDGAIDPMQVNYGALVPLLCAALADALDRIDALEAGP